jgi:hypothetical protein
MTRPRSWRRLSSNRSRPKKEATLKDGSRPEKYIQRDILNWLQDSGLLHWRQNSGVVFTGNRRINLGEEGLPDIVVVIPPHGRLVGLEVKSAKGRLRPAQREFMERVRATGGYYHVVRSLEQAMDAVAKSMGEEQWRLLSGTKTARVVSSGQAPPPLRSLSEKAVAFTLTLNRKAQAGPRSKRKETTGRRTAFRAHPLMTYASDLSLAF